MVFFDVRFFWNKIVGMRKNIDTTLRSYDFFFLMRPILFIPLWAPMFLGYATEEALGSFSIKLLPGKLFWINLLSYTLLMGAVYIINQIYDRESDLANNKLFLIPYNIISIKSAWIFAGVLTILSFVIGILFSSKDFIIILIISLILGAMYSIPPFQLKGKPFLDALSNGIGYGILSYLAGWSSTGHITLSALLYSLPLFFFIVAVFLNTTVPDIEGDKKAGLITSGVFMGKKNTTIVASVFMLYALIGAFIILDIHILISSLIGLILFVIAIFDDTDYMAKVSYRISSFVFVLTIGLKFPIFLLLGIIILILLRLYYERRFNYVYPTFFGR